MKEGRDGRRAPRVPIDLPGSLAGRTSREVRVVDLSLTGCLVRCDAPLDHGAILDLRLSLAADPFAAKVRVTESSLDGASASRGSPRYLAGVEFLGLPLREEAQLRRFLDEKKRRRGGAGA